MSRKPLAVGELGSVSIVTTPTGVVAEARTRDAAGKSRRLRASAPTEEEARAELAQKASELALAGRHLSTATTLEDLLDAWLEDAVAPRAIREQTKQGYAVQAGTIKRLAGALTIADLRPARLQALLEGLATYLTPANLKLMRTVLRQSLRYAVRMEVIAHSPLDSVDPVRARKKSRKKSALTPELIDLFRTEFAAYVADGPRYIGRRQAQIAVDIVIGLGGLRISEALAFRHSDIDFEKCVADLSGTLVKLLGKPIFRQDCLKGEEQRRLIALPEDGIGMEALRAARASCLSVPSRHPDAPLLPAQRSGLWIAYNTVAGHFDAVTRRPAMLKALQEAGLGVDDLTPHTLRRTVATIVADSEDDGLEVASGLLGHAHSKLTQDEYVVRPRKVVNAAPVDRLLSRGHEKAVRSNVVPFPSRPQPPRTP